MELCILTLGTVTRAIAARRLLSAARVSCRMVKRTGAGEGGGCAYALKIYESDLSAASRLLREANIPFEWARESGG